MEAELKSLRIDRSARREREPRSYLKLIVIAVLVALAAVGTMFALKFTNTAVPVETVLVQSPMSVADSGNQSVLTATGYIIAAHKIEVASKVNGRVLWIGVDKGDKVKAGQVLVRLEDDEYQAQVTQYKGSLANLQARLEELQNGSRPEEVERAKADVEQARADVANAKVTLDRTKQLVAAGVLAKQSLDDAQAKYDGDEAHAASLQRTLDLAVLGTRKEQIAQVQGQIEEARGALGYAQTQLDNTVIKAPVTGTILDRNVEKGEFITTGFVGDKGAKGYIVTMADLNDLQVELDIAQNDFPKLGPNQKGIITTDAYPDRKYQGAIEQVSPEADRAKATVQVKVHVDHPDDYLRPDMNATVAFYNDAPADSGAVANKRVVVIPASAVHNGSVFVVVNEHARKRPVSTGATTGKGIVIESGLVGGENLVVSYEGELKDGQRVVIKH
jgi:HlyD family secretion protein